MEVPYRRRSRRPTDCGLANRPFSATVLVSTVIPFLQRSSAVSLSRLPRQSTMHAPNRKTKRVRACRTRHRLFLSKSACSDSIKLFFGDNCPNVGIVRRYFQICTAPHVSRLDQVQAPTRGRFSFDCSAWRFTSAVGSVSMQNDRHVTASRQSSP